MASITSKGDEFCISLSQQEFNDLGLEPAKLYEFVKVKKGVWVMLEAGEQKFELKEVDSLEEKVVGLLKQKDLKDKVEGRFEKLLNEKELKKFEEMLKAGKVIKFKLSDKYKKAVYKLQNNNSTQTSSQIENKEKPFEEYTLEKDGFVVVKNEMRAKKLSDELKKQINDGEIKGLKSFDGYFYIIQSDLLEEVQGKVLDAIKKEKTINLDSLERGVPFTKTLVKIASEFLKEDGQIIEKRKGIYQFID